MCYLNLEKMCYILNVLIYIDLSVILNCLYNSCSLIRKRIKGSSIYIIVVL